jgi:hypothetical protein
MSREISRREFVKESALASAGDDYPTAPRPDETGDTGTYDNSWCRSADEVIDFMKTVTKPWVAFKVMAAGAIPPRKAFPHAFNSGADFVLAGRLPTTCRLPRKRWRM